MKVEKVEPLCDFCASETPTVAFLIPQGAVLAALRDERTGQVEVDQSMEGSLGSCESCAEIVRSSGATRITRLSRRVFSTHAALSALEGEQAKQARKIMRQLWRRWIRAIYGEQPHVAGSSPTDGLRVFMTPGEEELN